MALFFKTSFEPYLTQWKLQKKSKSVESFLLCYISKTFPGLLDSMPTKDAQSGFQELLKLLLSMHRHNKNDVYLQHPLVPFSVVRHPLYKYSK